MLKSPHAVKLVGSLFIAFSFFVVYSIFTDNLFVTRFDQTAQVSAILTPTPSTPSGPGLTKLAANLTPPSQIMGVLTHANLTLDDQNPPLSMGITFSTSSQTFTKIIPPPPVVSRVTTASTPTVNSCYVYMPNYKNDLAIFWNSLFGTIATTPVPTFTVPISVGGGQTKNISILHQNPPTILQDTYFIANPYAPCRMFLHFLWGASGLSDEPVVKSFITTTSIVPGVEWRPGGYWSDIYSSGLFFSYLNLFSVNVFKDIAPGTPAQRMAREDAVINHIDQNHTIVNRQANHQILWGYSSYNNPFGYYYVDSSAPATNCVALAPVSTSANPVKIVLMRDSRLTGSVNDFLLAADTVKTTNTSGTFSYSVDLKRQNPLTFAKEQSSCGAGMTEYVFIDGAPTLSGVIVNNTTRSVTVSGSWFLNGYNDVKFTSTTNPAQEYVLQNVVSATNKSVQFAVPNNISAGDYSVRMRTFAGAWSNALSATITDACTPTISAPAFDPAYITNTQSTRGFTPSLPVTPFDNFQIDFTFDQSCPATRVAQMIPTLKTGATTVLSGGSLLSVGSGVYRWKLTGWPNGIVTEVPMVSLLEQIGQSIPVTVSLQEGNTALVSKDFTMSSCMRVFGSGDINFVMMSTEKAGDDTAGWGIFQRAELLDTMVKFSDKLFTYDPFTTYKNRFSMYVDLKPFGWTRDWVPSASVVNRDGTVPRIVAPETHVLASRLSSCKIPVRNYVLMGNSYLNQIYQGVNSVVPAMADQPTPSASIGVTYMSKSVVSQPSIFVHETGHSFGGLLDEYVNLASDDSNLDGINIESNCTRDSLDAYVFENKMYGAKDKFGCMFSRNIHKPSEKSIMGEDGSISKFNKVSCGFIISKIKGDTNPKSHFPECVNMNVEDPFVNATKLPIEVLSPETDQVWQRGEKHNVQWAGPEGFSVRTILKLSLVKLGNYDETGVFLRQVSDYFEADVEVPVEIPTGEYRLKIDTASPDPSVAYGLSEGVIKIDEPAPAPVVTPSAPNIAPVTPGSSKTINGSGFTPTGNKVQLIKTGGVSSNGLFNKFKNFAVAITKSTRNSANIANILSGTVAQAVTITATTNTYEIKDIPSDGTTLTFTIPSDIPPGTYTMKVAGLNSNYSEGVTIVIASPVPAPIITSFNRNSSVVGSWVIAQGSGFSTSTTSNTDRVIFSTATTSTESVSGISASPTGDFYVEPSLPNLTFGNYSAFKIPTTLTPGVYTVKIARQNSLWSNSLSYTVLPARNPDGSYNFSHAIAMKTPPPVQVSFSMENTDTEVHSDSSDDTLNQDIPPSRATLIAQLLALIEQLTAQLEALKAGKTEISKTPTTTPSILPTAISCTQEVNQCPDGSFVGRTPPACTFQACPITTLPPAPVFACPTDVQICSDGTTVTRTLPTCLFSACPNPFTPPPPVVVTPPPPTITPAVVTPPPPTVTITPTPTPTEPTLSASLSSVYEDRAGQWGNFVPGINSQSKANDFVWNATLTLSGSKTIRAITINHNVSGEYWSTDNGNAYPLVIFHNNTQLNTAYTQTLGTYGAGVNNLVIYGQFENPTFSGGTLKIDFTDNTSVTATIPASSFSPCTDCGQTGAVWEAVGRLWDTFWALVAW